ncbi:MAG: tRNA (adenosine(37)-N6)-threonylcarbamoyltransferase complex ATPase subunit type 1 TsaE [Candidatus Omnitrophica bacterium]|nr:tRNA (adenosine(37)-N6)-threonylcarbamoyltransferase complex ATPase subunit type 1 TsaE [Candidatus Omnitrophota bacterium]
MKIITHSVKETMNVGRLIAKVLRPGSIVCLFGQLGSGKTVLTKGIAEGLGINQDEIISPTFVLMRQHQGRMPLHHFDLYRLDNQQEIAGLGSEEFLFADGVSVIEWAQRLSDCAPAEYLGVTLAIISKESRRLNFVAVGKQYKKAAQTIYETYRH